MIEDRLQYWFERSRTFAAVDAVRSRLTAAVQQSRVVKTGHASLDDWRRLDWPAKHLNAGGILVLGAATHALMLWAGGGVIGWVILIIPALAALIGGLAIALALMTEDQKRDRRTE